MSHGQECANTHGLSFQFAVTWTTHRCMLPIYHVCDAPMQTNMANIAVVHGIGPPMKLPRLGIRRFVPM